MKVLLNIVQDNQMCVFFILCLRERQSFGVGEFTLLVTLRSNDETRTSKKKTVGLISKTTTSHVHHTFLYISFLFLHDYDVKMPNFAVYGGHKQATAKFYFSF